ncbi:metal ABC transporter ATP-binding protein [Campylobacter lari]|nr:metal ABC transporter ATP-binding protein [Campylobacter lari]MCV3398741.1 metal ABC transporter ATP-binding protein [Campylobacter lari]MCV3413931.1 metal ABC transporter ATP-binding protein [Campylobacter lari]
MKLFEIKNLNFAYNNEIVLKNINLIYDNQDFLSIIGPNGGGKSTLIKLIFGLIQSKNTIYFSNIKPNEIGYVPQNTLANLNFPARVLEVVMMGRVDNKKFGFYSKEDKKAAFVALEKVNMQNFWDKQINTLSGGQRQRVFMARALVGECKLLILDEPTASVDAKHALQIFDLLKNLHHDKIGIICISHDINIVLAYSDKIAHLNKELFIHDNIKDQKKIEHLKHLYQNHTHICDVEMSLNSCLCRTNHA